MTSPATSPWSPGPAPGWGWPPPRPSPKGAAVVLADINDQTPGAATDELTASGHRALAVSCDVSDEEQVAALVERTVDTFGRLDFAFNNAGIQVPPTDAADEPAETFDHVNAINLRGVWACMKHELGQMREAAAPSSTAPRSGPVQLSAGPPITSKHGVLGLTKSAALEYAPAGSASTRSARGRSRPMVADMLAKGELDMDEAIANQPIARLGQASEIAAAVLWLCSPGASFVIGVALPVDGGYTAR